MSTTAIAREMAAAGPGCAIANGLLNAFETTKVKLQLHNTARPVYHTATPWGVMQQIIQQEGLVRGLLTPGLSASLTRSLLYGAYRVGLYTSTREWLSARPEPQWSHRMLSGMATGGLGALVSCPLDVVRTRLQADAGVVRAGIYQTGLRKGRPVRYSGMRSALKTIAQTEGLVAGLYRGSAVTVLRASLLNGAQLASYDTLKHQLGWTEGPVLHLTCAGASGVIAQTFIMPIDSLKSQMMLGKGWEAVGEVIRKNGPFWFYRGYLPACAGQGLIMILQMPLIEEFRRLLGVAAI